METKHESIVAEFSKKEVELLTQDDTESGVGLVGGIISPDG